MERYFIYNCLGQMVGNPYQYGTKEHNAWDDGWCEGELE